MNLYYLKTWKNSNYIPSSQYLYFGKVVSLKRDEYKLTKKIISTEEYGQFNNLSGETPLRIALYARMHIEMLYLTSRPSYWDDYSSSSKTLEIFKMNETDYLFYHFVDPSKIDRLLKICERMVIYES